MQISQPSDSCPSSFAQKKENMRIIVSSVDMRVYIYRLRQRVNKICVTMRFKYVGLLAFKFAIVGCQD